MRNKQANEKQLEEELTYLFQKHGEIDKLSTKKSRNGEYCFAFVEYKEGVDGTEAIKNLNKVEVRGKPMKVQMQDNTKRRKDPDIGCYTCGKKGHFARECRSSNNGARPYKGRSRSRSYQRNRPKRSRYHSPASDSYERERSRNKHKKSRHNRSQERDQKKKKKEKKRRQRSSSRSPS